MIKHLTVQNYRSIKEKIEIDFPDNAPLVLIGENNSGKSNVVRSLELLLGETWPGTYELSDYEYYAREKGNIPVEIQVDVEGVTHTYKSGGSRSVCKFVWCYPGDEERNTFKIAFGAGNDFGYASKETREQCLCIVVGADRRLSYQLGYSTKYTFMSKLMQKFHDRLTADQDRVDRLKECFEAVKAVFGEVDAFSAFTAELNNKVLDLSGNLNYGLATDLSAYDPSRYFHSLRVFPYEGNDALSFEELGTGQEQILALSFAYAYAKAFHGESGGLLLVIEEPEAHLHPLAQRWLSQKINDMCIDGVQIMITTHSPVFIDLMNLNGIVFLSKPEGATKVKQINASKLADYCIRHGGPATKINKDNILNFYSAAATEEILSGFFARKIVLVEGASESLALPIYFSRSGLDVAKNGIAIVPVHGKGNLSKWWRLFTAYGIPTYVIFDNDSNNDSDGKRRRDILRTLNISENDFDNILSVDSLKVEAKYAVFGKDFETTLASCFGEEYSSLEKEASQYGFSKEQSKPLIARFIAERISHNEGDDRWQPIMGLAEKIRTLSVIEDTTSDEVLFPE
jgi:putative ATP-dependent endonuclease of OLD family